MNENSFYIARYNSGRIDRKINLSQRDLTLAFSTGRFYGRKEGEIRIFKIDLDAVSVIEIPVSEILERIEKSREKRKEQESRNRKKEIQRKITELQAQL